MNEAVEQTARHYVSHRSLDEGMLNRVEAVVRAFDPCLSCSTHADGTLGMEVRVVGADGELLRTLA